MEMCSESGYGVVDGVGERMEYLRDGIHLESELESEKVVEKGVPLQVARMTINHPSRLALPLARLCAPKTPP